MEMQCMQAAKDFPREGEPPHPMQQTWQQGSAEQAGGSPRPWDTKTERSGWRGPGLPGSNSGCIVGFLHDMGQLSGTHPLLLP